jgi:hypothetical protein
MAFLIIEKGNSKDIGRKYILKETAMVIGRVTPKGNPDIMLHDNCISRQHAEICYRQNHFMIRDLGSTNGTIIDEKRIEPKNLYPLKHDSLIGLGIIPEGARVLLRFKESVTFSTTRIETTQVKKVDSLTWIKIIPQREEIWVDEKQLVLSKKEYSLILFLYNRAGKICHRDELISEVWREVVDPAGVSDAAIDQLIHRLRMKIESDPSHPKRLISKKGFGYMLI